jgi:hypothetical protein
MKCGPVAEANLIESVTVIQTELDQSGRNYRRRDLCKGGRRSDVNRSRETKNRMIPHVENIHAETKFVAFLNMRGLDD